MCSVYSKYWSQNIQKVEHNSKAFYYFRFIQLHFEPFMFSALDLSNELCVNMKKEPPENMI